MSLEIAPFDRAHTSSYSYCSVVTMSYLAPLLRYSETMVENRQLEYTHLYLATL